jgi:tetratricopeptide (TPR) repeat protein
MQHRGSFAGACLAALGLALIADLEGSAHAAEETRHAQIYLDDLGDEEIDTHEESDSEPSAEDDQFLRPEAKEGDERSDPPQSAQERKEDRLDPMLGTAPLVNPLERPKLLAELYEKLGAAANAEAARPIMVAIEELWRISGSDTVDLLLSRAERFVKEADLDLALQILDATVDIAPEDAEVWHQRAKVHALRQDYAQAVVDLKRTLSLDPKYYRAINDLGIVLEELGAKKDALQTYRKALKVNPFLDDARRSAETLAREVEGQDI